MEVDIRELSQKGEGIVRIQGLVVYVPNSKPGDHVKIGITRVGGKNAYAEIVD